MYLLQLSFPPVFTSFTVFSLFILRLHPRPHFQYIGYNARHSYSTCVFIIPTIALWLLYRLPIPCRDTYNTASSCAFFFSFDRRRALSVLTLTSTQQQLHPHMNIVCLFMSLIPSYYTCFFAVHPYDTYQWLYTSGLMWLCKCGVYGTVLMSVIECLWIAACLPFEYSILIAANN